MERIAVRTCIENPNYLVGSDGSIWNKSKGTRLKPQPNKDGYLQVGLQASGRRVWFYVSCLVASAFLGPKPSGYQVDHDNGIRNDNRLENLQYLTAKENRIKAQAKSAQFVNPDGQIIDVYNLTQFSIDNGLDFSAMCRVARGERTQHKGWTLCK